MLSYEFKKRVVEEIRTHFESECESDPSGESARLATVFKFLLLPHFDAEAQASAGALVELELDVGGAGGRAIRALYFLVPTGGGLVTAVDGFAIQVITDQSPIGASLLGKKRGESVEVESRGQRRVYRVTQIC